MDFGNFEENTITKQTLNFAKIQNIYFDQT